MEVIDYATTVAELDEKEIEHIRLHDATNPAKGYNMLAGGRGLPMGLVHALTYRAALEANKVWEELERRNVGMEEIFSKYLDVEGQKKPHRSNLPSVGSLRARLLYPSLIDPASPTEIEAPHLTPDTEKNIPQHMLRLELRGPSATPDAALCERLAHFRHPREEDREIQAAWAFAAPVVRMDLTHYIPPTF